MISVKDANKLINSRIIAFLDEMHATLTQQHLGPKARQKDVSKVKDILAERIEKLKNTQRPKAKIDDNQ